MKAVHLECPACRAKPGETCRTVSGKPMPESHSKRVFIDLYKVHFGDTQGPPAKSP